MTPSMLNLVWLVGCNGGKDDTGSAPDSGCIFEEAQLATDAVIRTRREGCGQILLTDFHIAGDGPLSLELFSDGVRIIPALRADAGDAVLHGLHMAGRFEVEGEAPMRFWRQGYQSWSPSGVFELEPVVLDADGRPVVGGDVGGFGVIDETPHSSWWAGLVGRSDGASVLVGAHSALQSKFSVSFGTDGDVHALWGHRGESIPVPAGQQVFLDPLYMAMGPDPNELWASWADHVATAVPPGDLQTPPPVGWATWYEHYGDVTEDVVRDNLARAAALEADPDLARVQLIQVDDGWSPRWGEWVAGPEFPSGMAALAAEIEAQGRTPGLWMAPFYVSREAPTYLANADWWVRDFEGEELDYLGHAVLDITHPDGAAWLQDRISERVAEGWTYLKLDFLYAGAEEGQRFEDMPGMVAYRRGMELIREAAGPDTWILACGAPLLPTVGLADSFRTGPDIAFELDPDPRRTYIRSQVRATAARSFTNGRWWWLDPDQLLVRDPLSLEEAQGSAVAQLLSGGAWILGDDLVALPDERLQLALNPLAVASLGLRATPMDPLSFASGFDSSPVVELVQDDDAVPTTWSLSNGWTALINLTGAPLDVAGPGGREVFSGEESPAGGRAIGAGSGEVWEESGR